MNEGVERARALWRALGLTRGAPRAAVIAALKAEWGYRIHVELVPMQRLIPRGGGTIYGCCYAASLLDFIMLIRDDLTPAGQDLVFYHELDHALMGDVVPVRAGDAALGQNLSLLRREDAVVTPREVAADEFAQEMGQLIAFGDPAALEGTADGPPARHGDSADPLERRLAQFYGRMRRW